MCGLRCALMSITRRSSLLIHHTPASGDLSDVPVLCNMHATDRLESSERCCGLCAGGTEKVAESNQNGSTTEESCGNSGWGPPLPAESQNSHVRDKLMEIAPSACLPCSLISGSNELWEQSQRWEDGFKRTLLEETWGEERNVGLRWCRRKH